MNPSEDGGPYLNVWEGNLNTQSKNYIPWGKKVSAQNETITLLHLLTHPIRYSIVKQLTKGKPLYISELSEKLGVDRKVVSFHLMTLEETV